LPSAALDKASHGPERVSQAEWKSTEAKTVSCVGAMGHCSVLAGFGRPPQPAEKRTTWLKSIYTPIRISFIYGSSHIVRPKDGCLRRPVPTAVRAAFAVPAIVARRNKAFQDGGGDVNQCLCRRCPATGLFRQEKEHTAKVGRRSAQAKSKSASGPRLAIYAETHICYIRFAAFLAESNLLLQENRRCREG
jgi:hypothetical protein